MVDADLIPTAGETWIEDSTNKEVIVTIVARCKSKNEMIDGTHIVLYKAKTGILINNAPLRNGPTLAAFMAEFVIGHKKK